MKITKKYTLIISPVTKVHSEQDSLSTLRILCEHYKVKFRSFAHTKKDTGFGVEMDFLFEGEKKDVLSVISEYKNWAFES